MSLVVVGGQAASGKIEEHQRGDYETNRKDDDKVLCLWRRNFARLAAGSRRAANGESGGARRCRLEGGYGIWQKASKNAFNSPSPYWATH